MPTQNEIRKQVTDQIIEALEAGTRPWKRPWRVSKNCGRPTNFTSRRAYSGVNPLLLQLHAMRHSLASKWWGTFKQWQSVGGTVKSRPEKVKPGRWGCHIVFYKPISKTVTDNNGDEKEDKFFILKSFTVFNADQVSGVEQFQSQHDDGDTNAVPDFAPADELIEATEADIRHGGNRAFYRPSEDFIQMPPKHRFDPPGSYYESLLHELGHWSEHRVGWDSKKAGYAMNELVAEMVSCFLATELGVPQGEGIENHAAYLKSWLTEMKNDHSFIFKASTQAGKVTDFLLSYVEEKVPSHQDATALQGTK